jgi:nuclear transport factor 2 (NTF2) superfamily protein
MGERPDWFRAAGDDRWELTEAGRAAGRHTED